MFITGISTVVFLAGVSTVVFLAGVSTVVFIAMFVDGTAEADDTPEVLELPLRLASSLMMEENPQFLMRATASATNGC